MRTNLGLPVVPEVGRSMPRSGWSGSSTAFAGGPERSRPSDIVRRRYASSSVAAAAIGASRSPARSPADSATAGRQERVRSDRRVEQHDGVSRLHAARYPITVAGSLRHRQTTSDFWPAVPCGSATARTAARSSPWFQTAPPAASTSAGRAGSPASCQEHGHRSGRDQSTSPPSTPSTWPVT